MEASVFGQNTNMTIEQLEKIYEEGAKIGTEHNPAMNWEMHRAGLEAVAEELGTCVHCAGTGDGYCNEDGWHDCEKCNGTGLKNGIRMLQRKDEEIERLNSLINSREST